jgi:hypothetical protein
VSDLVSRHIRCLLWSITVLLTAFAPAHAVPAYGRAPRLTEPRPRPAIKAVLDAFDWYPLVAIGEGHRNQQVHDFIVALLREPRFLQKVNDIVVEFGSARYQDVMDRYTGGDTVPPEALRRVWRDTVNILVWDAPVYERFFKTVRAVNRHRPRGARLRVLLADPPLDWANLHRREEWERVGETRDEHALEVIEREVLARKRRALLIFGSGHVTRDKAFDAYGPKPNRKPTLAELLEARHPGATLLIWSHMPGWLTREVDSRLSSWPKPALALLQGTWLGATSVGERSRSPKLEELADGFLYLGPTKALTESKPSQEFYRDPAYLRELLRRNRVQGGFNTSELERLRKRFLQGRSSSEQRHSRLERPNERHYPGAGAADRGNGSVDQTRQEHVRRNSG